jgi:hypothetical protein
MPLGSTLSNARGKGARLSSERQPAELARCHLGDEQATVLGPRLKIALACPRAVNSPAQRSSFKPILSPGVLDIRRRFMRQ